MPSHSPVSLPLSLLAARPLLSARPLSLLTALFIIIAPFPPARAQVYNPTIDVQHYDFSLSLNDQNNIIRGDAAITVEFRTEARQFELDLKGKNATGKGMT